MPGHIPSLDDHSLAQLRRYVHSLRHQTNGSLPIDQLVGFARDVRTPDGLTIDLRASEQLGVPLVVLRVARPAAANVSIQGLSQREAQVCSLVAEGKSNKQIAARLRITLSTVKDHVHRILGKLGVPNRAAIAVAYHDARSALPRHETR